jgi:V/A-type H+-transporting ATPase subunit D
MALLPLSANRMNMLMLRRRLVIARKGHKLLKDKQDELMRNFLELIDEIKGLRIRTEKVFIEAIRRFTLSTGLLPIEELEAVFIVPAISARVEISTTRLLNLRVPKFKVKFSGEILSYSLTNTPLELDGAMSDMEEALKLLIALAETEKKLSLLAREIDVTRRRVNALEYVMIPDLFETISFIRMKLEELERENLTRLMKVKDIIAQKRGI